MGGNFVLSFDKEWKKLDELHGLQEVGRSKIVALKSSNIEYFIPKAFAAPFPGYSCLVGDARSYKLATFVASSATY